MSYEIKTLEGIARFKNPPDGGWGWIVMIAAFCIYGISFGIIKSFGIYFLDIKDEFDITNSETSWISSLAFFSLGMAGLFNSVLSRWIDARQVVMLGGVLACIGMTASAYSPNIYLMYICAIISGTGHGIAFIACTAQISLYFTSWRPLATGIMLSGSSVSSFIFPFLSNSLLLKYGWRDSFIILGAISLNTCVFGALIRPIKSIGKPTNKKSTEMLEITSDKCNIVDKHMTDTAATNHEGNALHEKNDADNEVIRESEIERNASFSLCNQTQSRVVVNFFSTYWMALILLFGNIVLDLAFYVPHVYLVPYARSLNYSSDDSALLLAFTSIGDIVCRPLNGVLITHLQVLRDNLLFYIFGLCVAIALVQLLAIFANSHAILILYTVVFGCTFGFLSTTCIASVPYLMGTKNIDAVYGIFFASGSFAMLASAPIAGAIVDISDNDYSIIFWYYIVCLVATGFICLAVHLLSKWKGGVVLEKERTRRSSVVKS